MRTGIWLSTLAALLVVPTFAQDATVIFYAPGSITKTALKEMFTFKGDAAFMGSIFDGHQRLVGLAPNRFVTFRFPAGAHSFSAGTGSKHGDKDSQLPMGSHRRRTLLHTRECELQEHDGTDRSYLHQKHAGRGTVRPDESGISGRKTCSYQACR